MAKYNKKMALEMAEIYGMGKATVQEICDQFMISKDTFYQWKNNKPDFSDALDHFAELRRENIGQMALKGLEQSLTMHEFIEEKTEFEKIKDPITGAERLVPTSVTKIKKVVMPNARLIEYALNNIKSKEFRTSSNIDHTTNGDKIGFSHFLQQTKPSASTESEIQGKAVSFEETEETYTPYHREQNDDHP